jgi:hypothetical protein
MVRLVHSQTVLTEEVLAQLKERSGESTTKDALAKAVEHYIQCPYTDSDMLESRLEKVIRKRGK